MNFYKFAEEFDIDYYDPEKCMVYKIKNYNNAKRLGIPNNPGIEITDLDGKHLGYLPEE